MCRKEAGICLNNCQNIVQNRTKISSFFWEELWNASDITWTFCGLSKDSINHAIIKITLLFFSFRWLSRLRSPFMWRLFTAVLLTYSRGTFA
jgi:hypothetical protein